MIKDENLEKSSFKVILKVNNSNSRLKTLCYTF